MAGRLLSDLLDLSLALWSARVSHRLFVLATAVQDQFSPHVALDLHNPSQVLLRFFPDKYCIHAVLRYIRFTSHPTTDGHTHTHDSVRFCAPDQLPGGDLR